MTEIINSIARLYTILKEATDRAVQSHIIYTDNFTIDCSVAFLMTLLSLVALAVICIVITRRTANKVIYYAAPLTMSILSYNACAIGLTALRFIFLHYHYDIYEVTNNGTELPDAVWIILIVLTFVLTTTGVFYILGNHKAHFAKFADNSHEDE